MSSILKSEVEYLSHAQAARTLMSCARTSVLATLDADGHPYGSVVEHTMQESGDLLLLLSDLAAHTSNLKHDPRASLVAMETSDSPAVARSRVSVQGTFAKLEKTDDVTERYVSIHPHAQAYVSFSDFNLYRLRINRARFIAGFGRMGWVERDEWQSATVDPLAESAADIIEHMNDDHAHNLVDYARAYTEHAQARDVHILRLDHLGFDMSVIDDAGAHEVRLCFAEPSTTADAIHEAMVRLAREARTLLP